MKEFEADVVDEGSVGNNARNQDGTQQQVPQMMRIFLLSSLLVFSVEDDDDNIFHQLSTNGDCNISLLTETGAFF